MTAANDTPLAATATDSPRDGARLAGLLRRLARGSSEALAELYDEIAADLYALALWRTASSADAGDVVQEVFVRLATRGERLAQVESPRAYLLAMTHRAAVDAQRSTQRRAAEPLDGLLLTATDRDPAAAVDVERVSRCLRRLSAGQREAVYLRHFSGLTFAEIGRVAGVPTFTAASRYRLGMAKVRRLLGVER